MKNIKKLWIMIIIVIILVGVSIIISMDKFSTPNFIKGGIGFAKIMLTDSEIVQIQQYPKVYLAKPDDAKQTLINFMEEKGYKYLEDEGMGPVIVFGNEISKYYIEFSVNAYYSKWVFME